MTDKLLCDKKEAAALLGISIRTLEGLLSLKELRSIRIGRRRLIPIGELHRFCKHDHKTDQSGAE